MAVILEALAAQIQNILTDMVKEEVHMLLGVPNEINRMRTNLTYLEKFLVDADKRNITDESVREWVKEFRGTMYDATDILDLCQLKAMEQGPSQDMGCFNSMLFCIRNPLHAHDIGSRLKALNQKIDGIRSHGETFNFTPFTSYEDPATKKLSSRLASRETTGELEDVVGEKIQEDTRTLVEFLTMDKTTVSEHNEIMVFAIVGSGGIGKTTLAKRIFNNEVIQEKFDKIIWLSVNQNFDDLNLLDRTITEAGGDQNAAKNTKAALERTLKEALNEKKTLLVMDDVWDHKAWDPLLKSPLKNILAPGSRVLITTRHDKVARGMKAEKPYHHVDKLEQEDAWYLLKKEVLKNKSDEPRIDTLLKDIGMGIVARCDGLPLAVKAIGGLLWQKQIRRSDWENVLNHYIWSVSEMPEDLNSAIYLSYHDLPSSLKPCFLHFSLLPKNTTFYVSDIIGMWISEGFVHGGLYDLEELGREYYDELILRNLIEPNREYIDQSVCSMHDVVRSFAQHVARDEAFAGGNSQTSIIDKLRSQKYFQRISIETKVSESEQIEWTSLQTQKSLRTLIWVGPMKIKPDESLLSFSSLRSLHVEGTNFDVLAESLVHIKHLRYLCIPFTNTSMLPENIGVKLKFLQFISVAGCRSLLKLPGSIGKLQHLRTLDLRQSNIDNIPKGFIGLTNLRKIYGFPAHMDSDWCSLEALGPLSKLIVLGIKGLENISSPLFAAKAKLCEKARLCNLKLSWTSIDGDDDNLQKQQQMKELFDKLCPPPCLENFSICGYFGSRLPKWMTNTAIASLGNLRFLLMENLPYCTELPDSLCLLPCLELLKIKNAPLIKSIGSEFLKPHNHEHLSSNMENLSSVVKLQVVRCSGLLRIGNLPKMEELTIIKCPNLKVLEGMPVLQRLELEDYEMKMLPSYMQDINPMHLLVYCDVPLLTTIAFGKSSPEFDKLCHVRQVKAVAHDNANSIRNKWYIKYTRDPLSFKTNISRSDIALARRRRVEHLQLAYLRTCPVQEVPMVGHVCTEKRRPLCQRFRCNAYRRLVPWQRKACLHCCEADKIAAPSDPWTEAAVYSACTRIRLTPQQFARCEG